MTSTHPAARGQVWFEVHDVLVGYLAAVDGGDFDHVAEVLARARVITPDGGETDGAGVRAMYERLQPVPAEDGRRRTKHHLSNLRVSEPGPDGAVVAEAYYFVLVASDGGPSVTKSGRYREVLRRHDTGWAIHEHRIINDF